MLKLGMPRALISKSGYSILKNRFDHEYSDLLSYPRPLLELLPTDSVPSAHLHARNQGVVVCVNYHELLDHASLKNYPKLLSKLLNKQNILIVQQRLSSPDSGAVITTRWQMFSRAMNRIITDFHMQWCQPVLTFFHCEAFGIRWRSIESCMYTWVYQHW